MLVVVLSCSRQFPLSLVISICNCQFLNCLPSSVFLPSSCSPISFVNGEPEESLIRRRPLSFCFNLVSVIQGHTMSQFFQVSVSEVDIMNYSTFCLLTDLTAVSLIISDKIDDFSIQCSCCHV